MESNEKGESVVMPKSKWTTAEAREANFQAKAHNAIIRFGMKVATIDEAKNLETLPLDELIGNLETFETNLKRRKHKNSLAFKADNDSTTNNEDLGKTFAQLTMNLGKVIERLDNRSRRSSRGRSEKEKKKSYSDKDSDSDYEKTKRASDVKCYEYDDVGDEEGCIINYTTFTASNTGHVETEVTVYVPTSEATYKVQKLTKEKKVLMEQLVEENGRIQALEIELSKA
ncbi:hypothetical protein PTKIN_Ptkin05aG0081600 [Pterospermum kingtungense]